MRHTTLISDSERVTVPIHRGTLDVKEGDSVSHLRQSVPGDR